MKRIKITRHKNIHFLADCTECDFETGIFDDTRSIREVRARAANHVRVTGHKVVIESADSTWYELAEAEDK